MIYYYINREIFIGMKNKINIVIKYFQVLFILNNIELGFEKMLMGLDYRL